MKKRILKKKVKQVLSDGHKKKAILTVDMKNVTPNSKINVYISNKYEGPTDGVLFAQYNEKQQRAIVLDVVFRRGYTHLANFINTDDHMSVDAEVLVSDTDRSYYEIIPPYNRTDMRSAN